MTLRVLHCPENVGGHPASLARAERRLGIESVSVVSAESPFGYPADEVLRPPGVGRLRYEGRRARLLLRAVRDFDVVHFSFGRTIMPARLLAFRDLPVLRAAGKVIVVTFQGDDVRQGAVLRAAYPESLATACPEAYTPATDAARARTVSWFRRYAHRIYYLNPDLHRMLPAEARFLPYASVDPGALRPAAPPAGDRVVVAHAPTHRGVKGTDHVVAACAALAREGLPLELDLVEGVDNASAIERYRGAHLGVDQLVAGWYGGVAVEMMALGLPVVAYQRDEDIHVVPPEMRSALPVVQADARTVEAVIRRLVADPAERGRLGLASRAFVERWHDPIEIARGVVADYGVLRDAARRLRRS